MAPLKVIGAGFGRTGTNSLKEALNILGYTTHHMEELMLNPNSEPHLFTEAYFHPEKADFDRIYQGFDAAVDWPTAAFYEPLMKKYPEAKVILSVRDAEGWYKSASNTIFKNVDGLPEGTPEHRVRAVEMAKTVLCNGYFNGVESIKDKDYMVKRFNENTEEVKRKVPADRLLVFEVGEGWDRLCEFLGKPIPDVPYPNTNSTKEFTERKLFGKQDKE
ncbi:P-loop containing nucleoside triphosphate hydrolase protein [Syncephalastrum racemosum]|uniref:P-loop containing nucleoside triphosphate hydrolase protein n=1 Tax=Syncephalastrum racemosum TaxID=13706 RepID=A0A1X2HPE6_SYNRA|nr:P-loop containing nucleoside triphosphate hydrolase protein [Syncephalastrum racemosum]